MDVVAIEGLRSAHLEYYFLRLCAHFEALATMVLILGGAHDIVATTAVAVDLKKALRHSLLLLESAHAFFFHGLLLIVYYSILYLLT